MLLGVGTLIGAGAAVGVVEVGVEEAEEVGITIAFVVSLDGLAGLPVGVGVGVVTFAFTAAGFFASPSSFVVPSCVPSAGMEEEEVEEEEVSIDVEVEAVEVAAVVVVVVEVVVEALAGGLGLAAGRGLGAGGFVTGLAGATTRFSGCGGGGGGCCLTCCFCAEMGLCCASHCSKAVSLCSWQ